MERRKNIFCRTMTIVWLSALSVCACAAAAARFTIGPDPRIELLATVQVLSSYSTDLPFLFNRFDFAYRNRHGEYFSKFKGHRAVKLFEEISNMKDFDISAPISAILYVGNPPRLDSMTEMPAAVSDALGGVSRATKFIQALRDFAVETGFMGFYSGQREFYDFIISSVKNTIGTLNPGSLEKYCGTKQGGFSIALCPLFYQGAFGPRVKVSESEYQCYSVVGPPFFKEGAPYFGDEKYFRAIIWHEFGHSFMNPLIDAHWEEAAKFSALFEPIKDQMTRRGYPDWKTSLSEQLVEAIVVRLESLERGEEVAKAHLEERRAQGYVYTEAISQTMKERYEPRRDRYPTLGMFFSEILRALAKFVSLPKNLTRSQDDVVF